MATKKQKREAALAKREAYLEEVKAEGLLAQGRDKEHRARQDEIIKEEIKKINDRHRDILANHGIYY